MSRRCPPLALAAAALVAAGCADASPAPAPPPTAEPEPLHLAAPRASAAAASAPPRASLDGRAFPDKVLALTWDDGPDRHTLELAEYLAREKVSATFFVVSEWLDGVSPEPGMGDGVFETGLSRMPIAADLVRLGHRVGNHTLNHVLLSGADASTLELELGDQQDRLDPFLTDELRLFRAPGGSWSAATATLLDQSPRLRSLVGPVFWDIDRKDWEGSLYCRSSRPAEECERASPDGLRVKPQIAARRYLAGIEATGHGIVLLHDRVGHVGSTYALDVARLLVPLLKARGFVFAAPVLRFSPLAQRSEDAFGATEPLFFGDIDGDLRADACARAGGGLACALSTTRAPTGASRLPFASFAAAKRWADVLPGGRGGSPEDREHPELADVDGDRRSDLCARTEDGVECALASPSGSFGRFQGWSAPRAHEGTPESSKDARWGDDEALRFGDIDGDGRADVCGRASAGLVCARSSGRGFERARLWLPSMSDAEGWATPSWSRTLALGDVNGDGRADACGRSREGMVCALSRGNGFGHLAQWSSSPDFGDADATPWTKDPSYWGTLRLGDLNGDGRADVCGRTPEGLVCALSTGRAFTKATLWLPEMTDAQGWSAAGRSATIELADVNGDGRADVCGKAAAGVVCGMAP